MDPNSPPQNTLPPEEAAPPVTPAEPPPDIPVEFESSGPPIKKIAIIAAAVIGIITIIILTFTLIVPRVLGSKDKEDVELVYWGVWEDEEIYSEIIDEFEKANPHVTIKYEKQNIVDQNDYVLRLQTRINGGDGPDVYRFHNSMTPQLANPNGGYLLPLSQSVVDNTGLKEMYYPVIEQEMKFGGAYYGIPQYIDTLVLFVNEDIFKNTGYEYPTEWGYFLDLARNLTIVEDTSEGQKIVRPGAAMGTYGNIDHADDILSSLMLQSGVTEATFTDENQLPGIEGALEYYTCFARKTASCEPVWDETQQNSKLMFASGRLPMYFGYAYDLLEIQAMNPQLKITVLPLPTLGSNKSTVASYWANGISSKTKNPDEAYKFLEFISSKENMQIAYANNTKKYGQGQAYPRTDMAQILSGSKSLETIAKQAPDAKPFYFYSNTFDGADNQSLNKALEDAVNSIVNDGTSVQTAAATLVQNVSSILSLASPTPKDE